MNKQDLALNNLHGLIFRKTEINSNKNISMHTISSSSTSQISFWNSISAQHKKHVATVV